MRKILKTKFSILLSLLFVLFFYFGSESFLFAKTFSFRHYKVSDGLSFNTIRSVIQDKQGFIWIGTENGLNRFDGINFEEFINLKDDNTGKILSSYIYTLHEDKFGIIWIGTNEGIICYDPEYSRFYQFSDVTTKRVTINTPVNNICEDNEGNIWMSTYGQGVFGFFAKSKKLVQYDNLQDGEKSIKQDVINFVYADKQNTVWVAPKIPDYPLLKVNITKGLLDKVPLSGVNNTKPNFTIYSIFEDSNNILWLGTWDKGLCKLNRKTFSTNFFLSPQNHNGISHIHDINEYLPGELLIGSDDGLSYFNTKTSDSQLFAHSETDPTSLSDRFVYPIFKDQEGGIWIGTYYGGLNYLSPNGDLFDHYSHSSYFNSVNGNIVEAFTEDKYGRIWIATDDGGVSCLNLQTGKFTNYIPNSSYNSLSSYNVHAFCWNNDNLWIGTYAGGLNVMNINTGAFKHYSYKEKDENSLDGSSVYSIFKDKSGKIWIGTMSGINTYDAENDYFTRVKKTNSTTINIKQDKNGDLWFGTSDKGLYKYSSRFDKWYNYLSSSGDEKTIPSNSINCMAIDSRSQLWIGTSNGLCRYDFKSDSFIQVPLSVPNKNICSIVEADNALWITTLKGLIKKELNDGKSWLFTKADGLFGDQFIFNSGFKSSTGKLYFGTNNGFISFFPNKILSKKLIPKVVFTELEIFNNKVLPGKKSTLKKSISFTKQFDLKSSQNVFSINFIAPSFNTPEKNHYAYKLEGFDKSWNYVTNQYKATYTNLSPGTYTFKVKAANSDDTWNNNETSIKVVIHPPFWLTIGFKIFYLVIIIVIIYFIFYRLHKINEKKQAERIKELNQEKEKELHNAKIQFFTTIAHEIRTPVSLIIGPLEKIMGSKNQLPDYINKGLSIIDQNSQRLLLLINQLLDFRKVEQGLQKIIKIPTNVYEVACSVFERFKPFAEQKNYVFKLESNNKNLIANIDKEAITKIISNLLSNAIKFAKSEITVYVNEIDNDFFEIKVVNDGDNISEEEKDKIFEPFYQINSNYSPGTGLGLSLVKNLTEMHDGKVRIEDVLPQGVSFEVFLPIGIIFKNQKVQEHISVEEKYDFSKGDYTTDNILSESSSPEKQVLLIVDDNEEMRDFLRENFKEEYIIIEAENGKIGLEKIKQTNVDLVISDLMMPEMDGLEFCDALHNNVLYSHIPIVLLTAKTDVQSKIEGMNSGADAYVEKPFSISLLKARIKNLIANRKLLQKKFSEMPVISLSSIASNKTEEEFLQKLNSIIEENISNVDFNIETLANQLNISRSGLFAKIKAVSDVTPNDLLLIIRLKKAAELLLENNYRVNEIAYMVGFNSPSYFTKCFIKQFGIRPSEFAENSRKNQQNLS